MIKILTDTNNNKYYLDNNQGAHPSEKKAYAANLVYELDSLQKLQSTKVDLLGFVNDSFTEQDSKHTRDYFDSIVASCSNITSYIDALKSDKNNSK